MDYQQGFTTVANHLLNQNARAFENGRCLYRMADGRKCAIGVLIPDENYDPNLENHNATAPDVLSALKLDEVSLDDMNFLHELQHIHDTSEPDEWKMRLKLFAQKYNLTFPTEP